MKELFEEYAEVIVETIMGVIVITALLKFMEGLLAL